MTKTNRPKKPTHNQQYHHSHRHGWVVNPVLIDQAFHWSLGRAALIVLFGLFAASLAFSPPSPETGEQAAAIVGVQEPLRIRFNKPVMKDAVTPSIRPAMEGSWSYQDPVIDDVLYRELVFTPSEEYLPETVHHVVLDHLVGLASVYPTTAVYQFTTAAYPTVTAASVPNETTDLLPCEPIHLQLDQVIAQAGAFTITTSPELPLDIALAEDGTSYTVQPTECFKQGQRYLLTAEPSLEFGKVSSSFTVGFTTISAPTATLADIGEAAVAADIEQLTLKLTTAPAEAEPFIASLVIEPALEGNWTETDATTFSFSPTQDLASGTAYTVIIPKGAAMADGSRFEAETRLGFATLGPVSVIGLTPRAGAANVSSDASIKITFDQAVDRASAESAFSLLPAVAGSFSWNGNTLTFKPASLDRNASYTIHLAAGVRGTRGPASTHATRATFSTQEASSVLDIANDRQDQSLSCEVAALKMALNYKGAGVSEGELLNILGIDGPLDRGDTWGDPNIAFVGHVSGRQNTTGYGVHWDPIARISNNYRPSQAFTGWSISDVAREIQNGNPVEFWGTLGRASRDSWITPRGATINAWVGEHTRLVIGFTGTADNPTSFIINDPASGRLTWTASQFRANWAAFGNSGVVIR